MARPTGLEGRVGVHILTNTGEGNDCDIKLTFKTTNNKAEYEVLFSSLVIDRSLGAEEIAVWVDSQVVANQVQGEFATKSEKLKKCLTLIEGEHACFRYF